MSTKLNPEVSPFIPKSHHAINPKFNRLPMKQEPQQSIPKRCTNGDESQTEVSWFVGTDSSRVGVEEFPPITSNYQTPQCTVWSGAGLRSFKDVAASSKPPPHQLCPSTTMDCVQGSSVQNLTTTTKKKKKRSKKKEHDGEITQQKKLKPKSQGITLDQIVAAKIIEQVTKNRLQGRPKKTERVVKRKRNQESLPRNQLDSTAPKQRKGKTREVPKKKKPTKLKKFIMLEKEMRKRNLTASKEFKRKSLERVVDVVIRSVDLTDLREACLQDESGSGDGSKPSERKSECKDDLVTSMSLLSLNEKVSQVIHCNEYRDYCNQCLTDEIDQLATHLLNEVVRFQDRMHAKDPQKAAMKRRYCCGLKEVEKYLIVKKVKCLLLAPDIQSIVKDGVLDKTIHKLVEKCKETDTPIVYCLTRTQLGYLCKKRAKVSCVAILNPQGIDETFHSLIESAADLSVEYEQLKGEVTKLIGGNEEEEEGGGDGRVASNKLRCKQIEELRARMKRRTLFWRRKKDINKNEQNK